MRTIRESEYTFAFSLIRAIETDSRTMPPNQLHMEVAAMVARFIDENPAPIVPDSDAGVLVEAAQHSPALVEVARERLRQIFAEGWTAEHDDKHGAGELAQAASSYLLTAELQAQHGDQLPPCFIPKSWPWARKWWKCADQARNRIKGIALAIAEADRLKRAIAKWRDA